MYVCELQRINAPIKLPDNVRNTSSTVSLVQGVTSMGSLGSREVEILRATKILSREMTHGSVTT